MMDASSIQKENWLSWWSLGKLNRKRSTCVRSGNRPRFLRGQGGKKTLGDRSRKAMAWMKEWKSLLCVWQWCFWDRNTVWEQPIEAGSGHQITCKEAATCLTCHPKNFRFFFCVMFEGFGENIRLVEGKRR